MAGMTLTIGNKNYSSWSLRGWLAAKASGLAFATELIPLYEEGMQPLLQRRSPSGRVPVLEHEGRLVWDSLAIGEYLAQLAPEQRLLPAERGERALCRSVIAEMHSGFAALRNHLPMNIRGRFPDRGVTPAVQADINRITAIWRDCRGKAEGGPFLFGAFTLADAAFAPVVSRFRTYAIALDEISRGYADAVWAWPALAEWATDARHEPMVIESYEF